MPINKYIFRGMQSYGKTMFYENLIATFCIKWRINCYLLQIFRILLSNMHQSKFSEINNCII